jgi:hypothetical protein
VAVPGDANAVTIMRLVQTASTPPMLRRDTRCDLSEMTAGRGELPLRIWTVSPPGAQELVPRKPRGLDNCLKRVNGTQG